MFKFLLKDKVIQTIVDKITSEVNISLAKVEKTSNQKFDKVINHLEALRLEVSTIEKRLETKEIKDNVNYGQLRYQISAIETKIKDTKSKSSPQVSSH